MPVQKTARKCLEWGTKFLLEHKIPFARRECEGALGALLERSRSAIYQQIDSLVPEEIGNAFEGMVFRLAAGEPLAYILGWVDFYGLRLFCTPSALIPRQETELLVDSVLHSVKDPKGKTLLDLCTGGGCIGLSIKKNRPDLSVTLSDCSSQALWLARSNAECLALSVEILEGDLLDPFQGRKAHYLTCNPPYVSSQEFEALDPSVKEYEPKEALVGGEEGLDFYARLSTTLWDVLAPGGKCWFEIGSGQGKRIADLFRSKARCRHEIIQDWAGHDRIFFLEIQ